MICPNTPLIDICILIPCHNNFEGLIQSINSITYTKDKFAVLVVDDGSKEQITLERLKPHVPETAYLTVISLGQNLGITKALNKGLEFIYTNFSVTYIARLDCGDLCSPQRFYTQVNFLQLNPDIDLIGTWCYFKNHATAESYQYTTPTQHQQIKRSLYFRNVFVHPTVMWRFKANNTLKYPEQYPHAEDYGLFFGMILKMKSAIIAEFLVTCEINPKGISIYNRSVQLKSRLKVIADFGNNHLLFLLGAIKLKILMIIPYQFIFMIKKRLYNAT